MSLSPSSDHDVDVRRQLAADVVERLAEAGVPAHIATSEGVRLAGAKVEVDQFDDDAGGVFVDWNASQHLDDRCATALLANDLDHPAIHLNGAIAQAMRGAMESILLAGGFQVETSDDEYRPYSLRVISRPI